LRGGKLKRTQPTPEEEATTHGLGGKLFAVGKLVRKTYQRGEAGLERFPGGILPKGGKGELSALRVITENVAGKREGGAR